MSSNPVLAKRRAYDRAHGISARVDATRAREHIEALVAAGLTHNGIAAAVGASQPAISNIVHGQRTIFREREAAILAVSVPAVIRSMPSGWVSALGVRRRLQALMAIGWTAADIALVVGCSPASIQQWTKPRKWVRLTTREEILRAWDRMHMTPGPSAVNRARARRKGWAPPLAWDDIDDPAEQPAATHQERTYAHREDVAFLRSMGHSPDEIARRLGVTDKAIERRERRRAA